MKRIFFCFLVICVCYNPCKSFASFQACAGVAFCSAGVRCPNLNVVGCANFTTTYYNDMGVSSCTTCPSGFNKVAKSITVPGCSNAILYYDCEAPCLECPDCESTDWTSTEARGGYEKKVTATCNKTLCLCRKTTSYRCKQGFYGTSNSLGTSGCTQCPQVGVADSGSYLIYVTGETPAAGNGYSITDCYAPNTYEYIGTGGNWVFTENCYYTE